MLILIIHTTTTIQHDKQPLTQPQHNSTKSAKAKTQGAENGHLQPFSAPFSVDIMQVIGSWFVKPYA